MFQAVPLSIIRSFSLYAQQWYTLHKFVDSFQAGSGWNCSSILILLERCQQTCMIMLYVQWKTADDEQRNCPKHVEFHSKNKFEKLVHLVGFIIRICHDAQSQEHKKKRQNNNTVTTNLISERVMTTHYANSIPYMLPFIISIDWMDSACTDGIML
jgi:hypothetical protein